LKPDIGNFSENLSNAPDLVNIGKHVYTLHESLLVFHIVGRDVVCSATIERRDGSDSMATLSLFVTLLTEKSVLRFLWRF
jgi:hypothetical protein